MRPRAPIVGFARPASILLTSAGYRKAIGEVSLRQAGPLIARCAPPASRAAASAGDVVVRGISANGPRERELRTRAWRHRAARGPSLHMRRSPRPTLRYEDPSLPRGAAHELPRALRGDRGGARSERLAPARSAFVDGEADAAQALEQRTRLASAPLACVTCPSMTAPISLKKSSAASIEFSRTRRRGAVWRRRRAELRDGTRIAHSILP